MPSAASSVGIISDIPLLYSNARSKYLQLGDISPQPDRLRVEYDIKNTFPVLTYEGSTSDANALNIRDGVKVISGDDTWVIYSCSIIPQGSGLNHVSMVCIPWGLQDTVYSVVRASDLFSPTGGDFDELYTAPFYPEIDNVSRLKAVNRLRYRMFQAALRSSGSAAKLATQFPVLFYRENGYLYCRNQGGSSATEITIDTDQFITFSSTTSKVMEDSIQNTIPSKSEYKDIFREIFDSYITIQCSSYYLDSFVLFGQVKFNNSLAKYTGLWQVVSIIQDTKFGTSANNCIVTLARFIK